MNPEDTCSFYLYEKWEQGLQKALSLTINYSVVHQNHVYKVSAHEHAVSVWGALHIPTTSCYTEDSVYNATVTAVCGYRWLKVEQIELTELWKHLVTLTKQLTSQQIQFELKFWCHEMPEICFSLRLATISNATIVVRRSWWITVKVSAFKSCYGRVIRMSMSLLV